MIVIDASLAAKWVLTENDSAAALQFLTNHVGALIGPDLLAIEVASAIVRRGNENKAFQGDAARAIDQWTGSVAQLLTEVHPTTLRRLSRSGQLAFRLGHSIADCIYLALAIEFDCDLATCDVKFAAKTDAVWERVHLLAEYPLATAA